MALNEMGKEFIELFTLDKNNELRFELESSHQIVYVTLQNGRAEIFGAELLQDKSYEFIGEASIAIYTWHGCTIEIKGKTDITYIAKETPMHSYSNCHGVLEVMRMEAENFDKKGPTAMIVGSNNVGKKTLCRILLNYAVRRGRRPVFVDLDEEHGEISVPGTIGALLIEKPAPVNEGFSQVYSTVYHTGHTSPEANKPAFSLLVKQLSKSVNQVLKNNKQARNSGVVINTPGLTKGVGYGQILNSGEAFDVNMILVLGHQRLYNDLLRDVPSGVAVIFLEKSGGVVKRPGSKRSTDMDERITRYFSGYPKSLTNILKFQWTEIKIYKIGISLPETCLPFGINPDVPLTKLAPVRPDLQILNHLLAIVSSNVKYQDIISSPVTGFVCVTNIDMHQKTITLRSPQPLSSKVFLLSELKTLDNESH